MLSIRFLNTSFLSLSHFLSYRTPDRPYQNASCATPDQYIYGLRGNQTKVTKYARKDVVANTQAVIDRFRSRNVHYALGLLDNGPGDTHCEAVMQVSPYRGLVVWKRREFDDVSPELHSVSILTPLPPSLHLLRSF